MNTPNQTFADLLDLLEAEYVIQPGTKDKEGNTLMILNDYDASSNSSYQSDVLKVLKYLISSWLRLIDLVREESREEAIPSHIALLIDRRESSWEQAEELVEWINRLVDGEKHEDSKTVSNSVDWKRVVRRLYVLKPSGFASLFSLGNAQKLAKQSHVALSALGSLTDLHSHVSQASLPVEFEGTFAYDHVRWLRQRNAAESYLQLAHCLEQKVLVLTQRWHAERDAIRRSVNASAASDSPRKVSATALDSSEAIGKQCANENDYRTVAQCAQMIRDEEQRAYTTQIGIELFLDDVDSLINEWTCSSNSQKADRSNVVRDDASSDSDGGRSAVSTLRDETMKLDSCRALHTQVLERARARLTSIYPQYRQTWLAHRDTLQRILDFRRFDERAAVVQKELEDRMLCAIETARGSALETLRLDELEKVLQDVIALETASENQACLERLNELLLFGMDRELVSASFHSARNEADQIAYEPVAELEVQWAIRLEHLRTLGDRLRALTEECEQCLRGKQRVLVAIGRLEAWCTRCDALLEALAVEERERSCAAISTGDAQQVGAFVAEFDELVGAFGGETRRQLADVLTPRLAARIELLVNDASAHVGQLRAAHRRLENCSHSTATGSALSEVIGSTLKRASRRSNESGSSRSNSTFESGFNTLKRLRQKQQLELTTDDVSSDSAASRFDASARHSSNVAASEKHLLKCRYVVNELLETERAYVADLDTVLKGYAHAWRDDPALARLLPPMFRDAPELQFAALLGNLPALLDFHKQQVLVQLQEASEDCSDSDTDCQSKLCDVFIDSESRFVQLYATYCQSRSSAERLLRSLHTVSVDDGHTQEHEYFLECRRRLHQRLPLDAYLLKPTQRVTKYHLLLTDLLRHARAFHSAALSEPHARTAQLARLCGSTERVQLAQQTMLRVLASINNSLHEALIRVPSKSLLSSYGCLLLQAGCNVMYKLASRSSVHDSEPVELPDSETASVISTSLKQHYYAQRTHHRHLFLYERCILFCKRSDVADCNEATQNDSAANAEAARDSSCRQVRYRVKHVLELTRVGLTESLPGNGRRFELWTPKERERYIVEMKSDEEKCAWTAAIKKLLFEQLEQIKRNRSASVDVHYIDLQTTFAKDDACEQQAADTAAPESKSGKGLKVAGKALKKQFVKIGQKLGSSNSKKSASQIRPCDANESDAQTQEQPSTQRTPRNNRQSARQEQSPAADADLQSVSSGQSSTQAHGRSSPSRFEPSPARKNKPMGLFVALSDYIAVTDCELSVCEGDVLQGARRSANNCEHSEDDEPVYSEPTFKYVRKLATDEFGFVPSSYLAPREPITNSALDDSIL